MRSVWLAGWLGLVPGIALAEVWEDPDLAQALVEAEAVVRVRAPESSEGQPTVSFEVERSLKGPFEPGATLEVGGLHDPTRVAGAAFAAGEQAYLILRRDSDGRLVAPTPTFGRYPLREGVVKYATLRDTFLRVDLPEEDWVRYLELHLGRRDDAWVDGLRRHLAQGSPQDTGSARARHYLALEVLALAGASADAEVVAGYQRPSGPFQLRISACRALAGILEARAAANLFAAATKDPEPAVRTTAIQLLAALDPAPPGLERLLARAFPSATLDTVRFVGINDPRSNTWPSPRLALIHAFRRLGPASAKDLLLGVLEGDLGPDEAEGVALALIELRDDPALPGELVDRFRPAGEAGDAVNRVICGILARITGQELGQDTTAWLNWVTEQGD